MNDETPLIEPATIRAIDDALAAQHAAQTPRGHLGMSAIGGPCERLIWLKFRWSLPDTPSPRILRVFKAGNMLEDAMTEWLKSVPGIELHTAGQDGKQINFKLFGGHFAGSLDGVIKGIPEAPKTWHVWECKTANTKRFAELVKTGIKAWSPEYWSQVQCYMGSIGMDRALFTVINKDDSTIYTERVTYEPMVWDALQARALRILEANQPPPATWKSPDDWQAKMKVSEDARGVYFGRELPAPNCRNCVHSSPVLNGDDAAWACSMRGVMLTMQQQQAGCEYHKYITGLMPFECMGESKAGIEYKLPSGTIFANGPNATDTTFNSAELHQCSKAGFNEDVMMSPDAATWRTEYGGRFVAGTFEATQVHGELTDSDIPF